MVATKSWKALGTSVHVLVTDNGALPQAELAVREILQDVDAAYSRFRADSELSRLNAAGGRSVQVSPLLGRAIEVALRAARVTGGAVDPTIGAAIRVAGYDDDFAKVVADRGPLQLRAVKIPGWQVVRFDRVSRSVVMPEGVELDLGSTGKALAADLATSAAQVAIQRRSVL